MMSLHLSKHSSVGEAVSSLQALIQHANIGSGVGDDSLARLRRREVLAQLRNASSAANAAPGFMPSGPRKPGEGCEDEEQGVLSAELTPTGGARLRLTLLVAGFVVGPSGASVRDITRHTGCDIRSHTDTYTPPGVSTPRKVRTFLLEGKRRAVVAALGVVTDAVDRYCELCGGRYCQQAVEREQRIRGVTFFYSPPPRAAVPYAAALRTHFGPAGIDGTGSRSPRAGSPCDGSPPSAVQRLAPSLPLDHAQALAQQQFMMVPVPGGSSLAGAGMAGGTMHGELLAALHAAATPQLRRAASLGREGLTPLLGAPTPQVAGEGTWLPTPVAHQHQPEGAPRLGSQPSAAVRRALALTLDRQPTDCLDDLLAAGAASLSLSPLQQRPPGALTLERQHAGCLDDLLAAEAAAALLLAPPSPAPAPGHAGHTPGTPAAAGFSLFSGGGQLFPGAADALGELAADARSIRLGSPTAVLPPGRQQLPAAEQAPCPLALTGGSSDATALAACGFPTFIDFAATSPGFHSPALAALFHGAGNASAAPQPAPGAPGGCASE